MYLFLRRGALLTASLLSFTLAAEQITTTLELKPRVSMEQLAQNVQNPASAHFNRFYEPSEIRALAAPSDQQYSELLSGLVAEGFTIVKESPTHLWVSVRGEKAIYE